MALKIISCECDDVNCQKTLEITEEVFMQWMSESGQRVVVDGCVAEPPPGEVVLERGDGYAIYSCPTLSVL